GSASGPRTRPPWAWRLQGPRSVDHPRSLPPETFRFAGVIPGHRGARETPTRYGSAPTRSTAHIAPKDAAPRGIEARAGTFHAPRRAVGAQARVFSVRDGAAN